MSDLVNQAEETLLKSKGMAFAEIEETVFDLLSREIDYGEVFVQSTRSESFGLEDGPLAISRETLSASNV